MPKVLLNPNQATAVKVLHSVPDDQLMSFFGPFT